jgi:hypothetical protein
MISESYNREQIYQNGQLVKEVEKQKVTENNNIIFMKDRELVDGHKKEIVYRAPTDFRKTQKHVHFSPINQTYSILDKTINSKMQGMPNIPLDSLLLYRRKQSSVHSKKNRKGLKKTIRKRKIKK